MAVSEFVSSMQMTLGAIIGEYLIIFVQCVWASFKRGVADAAVRAQLSFAGIFFFCSIAGYLFRAIQPELLVSMCLGNPANPTVILLVHLAIVMAAAVFILTDQMEVIFDRFKRADEAGKESTNVRD